MVFSAFHTLHGIEMRKHRLNLSVQKAHLAICRLSPEAQIPDWASNKADFTSITRTNEELSIICPESYTPPTAKQESGYRLIKVAGPLDFSLTGILASLASPLAKAGISIIAISTFDTDYLIVKEDKLEEAIKALRLAGHSLFGVSENGGKRDAD